MRLVRYRLGVAVMLLGMRILPPGRVRSELFQMIDLWSTQVRIAVAQAADGDRT